jgi:hypothetical protein
MLGSIGGLLHLISPFMPGSSRLFSKISMYITNAANTNVHIKSSLISHVTSYTNSRKQIKDRANLMELCIIGTGTNSSKFRDLPETNLFVLLVIRIICAGYFGRELLSNKAEIKKTKWHMSVRIVLTGS